MAYGRRLANMLAVLRKASLQIADLLLQSRPPTQHYRKRARKYP
jgi:hypothetical protein